MHVMTSELDHCVASVYVCLRSILMYITNNSAVGLITKISDMLNKNSLGLLKKVQISKVESRVLSGI